MSAFVLTPVVLLDVGPKRPFTQHQSFDQERLNVGLLYRRSLRIRLEIEHADVTFGNTSDDGLHDYTSILQVDGGQSNASRLRQVRGVWMTRVRFEPVDCYAI